jgi:hypothetical protein
MWEAEMSKCKECLPNLFCSHNCYVTDYIARLKVALKWALTTCRNAADLIDDDADETPEVLEMIEKYEKLL